MRGAQAATFDGGRATQVFNTFPKLTSIASMAKEVCGLSAAAFLYISHDYQCDRDHPCPYSTYSSIPMLCVAVCANTLSVISLHIQLAVTTSFNL